MIKKIILSLFLAVVLTYLTAGLNGIAFNKMCGNKSLGFPFAFTASLVDLQPGVLHPMCIDPVNILLLVFDILFWGIISFSLIYFYSRGNQSKNK